MRLTSLSALHGLVGLALMALPARASIHAYEHAQVNSRAMPPDVYNIKVAHLDPEDAVWDPQRKLLYQSNLYRAKVSVSDTKSGHKFDALIPNISSNAATTPYELAGLSLDKSDKPTRLYGVAKDHSAFTFGAKQSKKGPNAFVAFDLPLSSTSKPVYNLDLHPVQGQIEAEHGTWPFAPVDSAQDAKGNSYIVFALGAPAVAKVGADGKKAEPFAFEDPKDIIPNRPGYTGIAYVPSSNLLVAYGGPRLLTAFDLSSSTPGTPRTVEVKNGDSIKWRHAEKINLIPSLDGTGDRLVVTNAPDVISFRSTDGWKTATYKTVTRAELKNNSLTTVTQLEFDGQAGLYGAGAYFGNGKFNPRTEWPLYRLSDELLKA